jgi:thiol-disulfide isomerase/thioredoxin
MAHRIIRSVSVLFIVLLLLAIGVAGYYFLRVAPLIKRGKLEGVSAAATDRLSVADFSFETAGGAQKKIADFKGKVIVIDVWATWCGTCLSSIPKVVELHNKYLDKPVKIIGLNVDDDGWAKAKPFLEKHPEINYEVAVPNPAPSFLLKSIVDLKPLGEVSAVPTFFVVDRHGRLAGKFIELGHEQEIDDLVAQLINE